jgi:cytochrome c peroxidase
MKERILKCAAATVLAVGLVSLLCSGDGSPTQDELSSIVDPQNLRTAYLEWKEAAVRAGADRALVLQLGYSKGLSSRFVAARGHATVDLVEGSVSVEVSGLAKDRAHDVWLVDNRPGPGRSVMPEPGDPMLRIGRLQPSGGTATLHARLGRALLTAFKLDQVVVTPADENPAAARLLFGSPSLFQRLFYAEQRERGSSVTAADAGRAPGGMTTAPFSALVPAPAFAQEIAAVSSDFSDLVARGERLFLTETFNGNGRTCGTCHPAENNFTIDPKFIASRPRTDPLFVAEFNPALKDLENPRLMRHFGLILENVDGFENPPAMRGVPHTLALRNSLEHPTNLTGAPEEMTGWSGDGSPGGTLRDFATGAVTQHLPRTLHRVPGVDFRLPTSAELDAMEAFQLALGRQEDLDLTTLVLRHPMAVAGQTIFVNGTGSAPGKCSTCHANAGALNTPNGENRNFNTGVEDRPDAISTRAAFGIARDAGFGTAPNASGGFGDGRFNATTVVEAADTGPFFHNNAVTTIEDAVRHYTTDAFNSVAFAPISMEEEEIQQVAAFLRVINAVENDRSAVQYARLAAEARGFSHAQRPLALAIHDLGDAIRVLTQKSLHTDPADAVDFLYRARRLLQQARITTAQSQRLFLIRSAIEAALVAHGKMVQI